MIYNSIGTRISQNLAGQVIATAWGCCHKDSETQPDGSTTIWDHGDVVREVSVSGVTDTYAYDALGRQISHTDGRGGMSHTEYNALGLRSASIDALGNRTAYAYDRYGNISAVTNPLGNAVVYEYDLRGRRTYEGGATYPVRYTYDVFGNKTTMTTYRNESLGPSSGDVTTWRYDEASNCMTNKVYADGKGPRYGYTPDGRLSQRIWARGIVTDYSYDGWGSLTNTVYSDGTPTVTLFYDAMGRQTNAVDAAGVTSFAYDDYGSLTNETVVGAAGENTIIRHWDAYGRTAGYTLNNVRQTTIGYDPATGRIATMLANGSNVPFTWSYLPGSDLKSSLAYPNGLTASWTYDADDQLLQVRNATPTDVISQYDYTYDAAGRRIEIARSGTAMSESRTDAYGYNVRNELTSATKTEGPQSPAAEYAYQYDDIGNRITSTDLVTNRTYTANSLNQYTLISNLCDSASLREEFIPQFDDDGNQTIQTSTGVWSVQYNGENRPVLWTGGTQSATTNIVMSFDRMGRRVEYRETQTIGAVGGNTPRTTANAQHRFVYDNYLCIQRLDAATANAVDLAFVWDVTESVTTRPLIVDKPKSYKACMTHDGNKNVSDIMSYDNTVAMVHYEYDPFGKLKSVCYDEIAIDFDLRVDSPYLFSSELFDDVLGLIYYNHRHYEAVVGRWINRDPLCAYDAICTKEYLFTQNRPMGYVDFLGLEPYDALDNSKCSQTDIDSKAREMLHQALDLMRGKEIEYNGYVCCACVNGKYQVIATGPEAPQPNKERLVRKVKMGNGKSYWETRNVSYLSSPKIQCPRRSKPVGYYHSHPGGSNFSPKDMDALEHLHYAFYLVAKNGEMKKAIPRRTKSREEANRYLKKSDWYAPSAKLPDGYIIPPRVVPFNDVK